MGKNTEKFWGNKTEEPLTGVSVKDEKRSQMLKSGKGVSKDQREDDRKPSQNEPEGSLAYSKHAVNAGN